MAETGPLHIDAGTGEGHVVLGPGGFEYHHALYRVRLWTSTTAQFCAAVLASAVMFQVDERPEWMTLAFGVTASLMLVPTFYMMCVSIALNYLVRK